MSPKGGIRPHEKFSISANRSEVLFVDYIAEHLRPGGRAGVIVPEGIIFQSANAYKALRKELIENHYLVAVVSLPAGVFNPYSGVKTSILLLDRQLAKNTENILFAKVEADGFDLGAQRRPIERNDLPQVLCDLKGWMEAVRNGKEEEYKGKGLPPNILIVSKSKLGETGDYNLTADRYRDNGVKAHHKWPMVRLGEVCDINPESNDPKILFGDSNFVYLDISSVENNAGKVNFDSVINSNEAPTRARRIVRKNDILISTVRPNLKAFAFLTDLPDKVLASTGFAVLRSKTIEPKYLYYIVLSEEVVGQMKSLMGKGSYPSVNSTDVEGLAIPLPPIEVQREIVAEIEGYQKLIDGARQVVDSWKPKIDIDPSWPQVKLGDNAIFEYGFTASACDSGNCRLIRITDITDNGCLTDISLGKFIDETEENRKYIANIDDVFVARTGATFGKTLIFSEDYKAIFASYLIRIILNKNITPRFYWYFTQTTHYWQQANSLVSGGGQPQFNANVLKDVTISLPPVEIQKQIVDEIENERRIVEGNRELIRIYEAKIKKVIDSVWEE